MKTPSATRLAALLLAASAAHAAAPRPPNIVFILGDDLGPAPVSAYGSTYYRTPAIDSIGRDGIKFTDAYAACPVCSPTRAALMTGQHPARTRVTDFIPGNPYPFAKLTQPDWQKFLPLSARTVAEELIERGYATGLFGKWHLARSYTGPDSIPEGPDRQGFQEVLITHKPVPTADPEADAHSVAATTARALEFMERHRDRPFFLYLPHNSIHSPIMAPKALVEKWRGRPGAGLPENNPVLGAMMEILDDSVGRVLSRIDSLGLRENTIVVFYGDNGGLLSDGAQTPFRGGKAHLHEGGIRVPLLIRWPGVIAAGRVSTMPVTTVDFFPTLLELSGPPAGADGAVDGISLVSHLRGGPAPAREAIFWHYPHYHHYGEGGPAGAIRAGDWKLVEFYEHTLTGTGRVPELYNLRADPGEKRNLSTDQPAQTARLLALLAAHRAATRAQMPVANPRYDPAKVSLQK